MTSKLVEMNESLKCKVVETETCLYCNSEHNPSIECYEKICCGVIRIDKEPSSFTTEENQTQWAPCFPTYIIK